jgi:hypothetical protein
VSKAPNTGSAGPVRPTKRFDYSAPAEVYILRPWSARRYAYRRFESAAEAIRFSIEELPPQNLVGAVMEVDEARFDHKDIRALYAEDRYPLARR